MKLSFGPWGETLDEFISAGISAEQKGFSTLWASELHRTPFVPLTALATNTSEVKLGSGVALAFLRSPLTLALTALDLNEISNGRFILGLGSGVKNLNERILEISVDLDIKNFFKRKTGELSSGQKNRVSLAKSLINKPEILLLDDNSYHHLKMKIAKIILKRQGPCIPSCTKALPDRVHQS